MVLDEAAYGNSPVVARVHGLEIVRAGGTDENSDIRFRYQVEDTRPGRDLQRSLSLNHAGRLAEAVNANPKVRVALGRLGNAIKGEEIIIYNNLQEPVEARDSEGNVIKRWEGVRYGAHPRGGILEEHTIVKARELAPQHTDRTRLTLRNGNFEKEDRIGVFGDWLAEIKSGWGYLIAPIVAFLGLLGLGKLFERARIHSAGRATAVKGTIAAAPAAPAAAVQAEPLVKSGYGFDDAVVATANLQWSAVEERLARGESAESIAAEYFVAYNIWLEQVLGETKITPTLNDLWIFFLVQAGAGYFHNDTPAFFSYLLYNALQLKNDSVGTFVRGEYERWYKIINLTLSTYKGIAVFGKLRNILPYEYVFNF